MRIFHKIALVGGIPLVLLLGIAWQVLVPKVQLVHDSTRWDQSIQVMQACSDLIHVLQVERGSTAVYIKGGSANEMNTARANVDSQLEEFYQVLASIPASVEVQEELAVVGPGIESLRREVGSGAQLPAVFTGYTDLVGSLIERIRTETHQKTGMGIGKRFLTLAVLEQSKENAGRFRAFLASTAAADKAIDSGFVAKLAGEKERAASGLDSPVLVLDGDNREMLEKILQSKAWQNTNAAYTDILGKSHTGSYGLDSGRVFGDMTEVINGVHGIIQNQQDLVRERTMSVHKAAQNQLTIWTLALILAITLSLTMTWIISRNITRPLNAAVLMAEEIALGQTERRMKVSGRDEVTRMSQALNRMAEELQGRARLAERIANRDLTVDVQLASEEDLLGHALRRMVRTLRQLIQQAGQTSNQVSKGASEIASASQSLSQGSTTQAATLEEISASITEISGHTKENADNAARASELTHSVQESAEGGIQQMTALVSAMEEINTSSQQIGAIIKTVDDIAFQTNLLALNAAVEAARAGVHGKGFAVVAEEVRSLAGRSAKAARETSQLIEDSLTKVKQGAELADTTAESFQTITGEVTSAANLVGEIAQAAADQAGSIQEISEGLRQVDNVVQQGSAAAEELASSAEVLFAQSKDLAEQLDSFQTKESSGQPGPEQEVAEAAEWAEELVTS